MSRTRSKRYREGREKVDRQKGYTVPEAVALLKGCAGTKFDQTVEIAMKLGIDSKQSDQTVRGSISLPKGIGRELRVIAFAQGDRAKEAQDAGADAVGGEDLAKRVQDGWDEFDVAVACPDMMRVVGKLGRILGPVGKMPSPKSGTVIENIGEAVKEFKAGKMEYRNDTGGNVHAVVGKLSFSNADLEQNIQTFITHITNLRPASVKGVFVEKVTVSSTMSPGVKIAI